MDRKDIDQTRTNAHERMTANERYRQRRQDQEHENDRNLESGRDR